MSLTLQVLYCSHLKGSVLMPVYPRLIGLGNGCVLHLCRECGKSLEDELVNGFVRKLFLQNMRDLLKGVDKTVCNPTSESKGTCLLEGARCYHREMCCVYADCTGHPCEITPDLCAAILADFLNYCHLLEGFASGLTAKDIEAEGWTRPPANSSDIGMHSSAS